jgi:hypothetical protein
MNVEISCLPRQIAAIFSAALAVAMLVLILPVAAGDFPIYTRGGVAIKGADPVAYFTEGKPVIGQKKFESEWKGARWRFASAQNRDMFVADPEKFAPQYGGYCSYAVSQGYTAKIDTDAWAIVDGNLYLNYSTGVLRLWETDIPGHIASANKNWPSVRN